MVWEPCFARIGEAIALLKLALAGRKITIFPCKTKSLSLKLPKDSSTTSKTLELIPSLKLTQPLKIKFPKRNLVFQPSTFRCELLVSGRVVVFIKKIPAKSSVLYCRSFFLPNIFQRFVVQRKEKKWGSKICSKKLELGCPRK